LAELFSDDTDLRRLGDEIGRLESQFPHLAVKGTAPFDAALAAARRFGDDALLGRALCLSARGELVWGRLAAGIAIVEEAISVFDRLSETERLRLAGPHSEAWRVAGNARIKLGEIAAALPLLEHATILANNGVEAAVADEAAFSAIPATSALVRCRNNMAMALISMREMTGAKEVLLRALEAVDAHPQTVDDVPDDIIFIVGNLITVLLNDARERLAAGESADAALAEARRHLGRAAKLIDAPPRQDGTQSRLSVLGERDFLEASSQTLLFEGRLDAALEQFQRLADSRGEDRWRGAIGERGLAEALLALGRPEEALAHAHVALAAYDQNEEIVDRAAVFLVLSRIYRALGEDRQALDSLEQHHRLRGQLDALAARQYAGHMAARLGLERARAEAEAQRRIADELKALNGRLMEQAAVLERQAQALGLARTAAEKASRAKSSFLANMSHELRTPLNAILGFAEMLRDNFAGPPGPAWNGYAGMIHEAGSHLLAVIGEILDLSKIEAGRVTLSIEPVDLADLFDACGELIAPMVERGGILFEVDLDPSLIEVPADPVRLKQILLNLLSNAAKFTPPGGRVTLLARPGAEGAVEIRVEDTGVGMTALELQLALEIFGQVESNATRKHQGSGLGLPIAIGLAELHGGSLTVRSEKGVGTTVAVTLPGR
jgi:signal transduction histidine kinase